MMHSLANPGFASKVPPKEAREIAQEAYVYGFPMVMHYKTMTAYTLDKKSPEFKAPFNQLGCDARLYTPEDKAIVTPNSDTPYCMGFLDLSKEPMVLRVPQMEPKRYYSFQLIDAFTHNYAYVGTLTTGNGAADYLLVGPKWKKRAPKGIKRVIKSETDIAFMIARTQLFNEQDLKKVSNIQASYKLMPLSTYPHGTAAPFNRIKHPPKWFEGSQFDARSFTYLNFMLNLIKPSGGERSIRARFAKIGLGTGGSFDLAKQPANIRSALEDGAKAGFSTIEKFITSHSKDPSTSGKVFGTRKFLQESAKKNFGLDSLNILRAAAAHSGLYGNSVDEALYPAYFVDSEGAPLDASKHGYTITFPLGKLPPVKSFWSLTMYDAKTQLLVANPIKRYLLNSMMLDQFKKSKDGSLTFNVQGKTPGPDLEANWLPAPTGPFYLIMRLYGPKPEALKGKWRPPPLKRAK
jgi:hypothetical protein